MTGMRPLDDSLKDDFRGPDFIGLLEDQHGYWQDICCWSGAHGEFMPRVALPDPKQWRRQVKQGTKIIGWWPMPPMPSESPVESYKPLAHHTV